MTNKLNMFSKHVLVKSCILKILYEKKQTIRTSVIRDTYRLLTRQNRHSTAQCADSVSRCNRLKAARRSLLIVPQMAGKSLEASFFEHLHTAA